MVITGPLEFETVPDCGPKVKKFNLHQDQLKSASVILVTSWCWWQHPPPASMSPLISEVQILNPLLFFGNFGSYLRQWFTEQKWPVLRSLIKSKKGRWMKWWIISVLTVWIFLKCLRRWNSYQCELANISRRKLYPEMMSKLPLKFSKISEFFWKFWKFCW